MYKGIDVSDHNGHISVEEWQELKNQGVEFAIIRLGWGNDELSQDDREFENNCIACEQLNIPYGVYIYSYALNMEELQSEIAHTKRLIEGKNITLGVWFDMEDADGYKYKNGLNPYENSYILTDFAIEFVKHFENLGLEAGVYSNPDYFKNVIDKRYFSKDEIWLAHWEVDEPWCNCEMWQYTSNEHFDGFACRFDANLYYGELPPLNEDLTNNNSDIDSYILSEYNEGDNVHIITDEDGNFYDTNGTLCHAWHKNYTVIDTNNDGVCIGVDGVVTARVPYSLVRKE